MAVSLEQIAICVERGKINKASPFPSDLKGQDGADELTAQALREGVNPQELLTRGLIVGMQRIGEKFRDNKVFVPEVLLAAKAMQTAMKHLRPFFLSGAVKRKGKFVIGTVSGDLHDIGKNLVAMMVEGSGWEVIDLGIDVTTEKFLGAVEQHAGCALGLSALLTTTMVNMEKIVKAVKDKHPSVKVLVGGAPLSSEFAKSIGADCYSPDPQGAVDYLNALAA
jgi:methanogenic corrinoid protein MtbC1